MSQGIDEKAGYSENKTELHIILVDVPEKKPDVSKEEEYVKDAKQIDAVDEAPPDTKHCADVVGQYFIRDIRTQRNLKNIFCELRLFQTGLGNAFFA